MGIAWGGTDEDLEEMKAHPLVAFRELLRRFGLPVRVGVQQGLFLPYVQGLTPQAMEVAADEDTQWAISSFQSIAPDHWEGKWIFAIDSRRYRCQPL